MSNENALVECAICGEQLVPEDCDHRTQRGEPAHAKCVLWDIIGGHLDFAQHAISEARANGHIDAELEATLERLLRHTSDELANYF